MPFSKGEMDSMRIDSSEHKILVTKMLQQLVSSLLFDPNSIKHLFFAEFYLKHNITIKIKIAKHIKEKKVELKKLKKIYSEPNELPAEIKVKVAKKITETKTGLKRLYSDPKNTIDLPKVQKWAAVQIVKAFLGIPIVPGK